MRIVYLSDANLRCVYLLGADLRGANLEGADLSDAYLSGIMKMCEAMSKDHNVELLTYNYHADSTSSSIADIFEFYNVSHSFKIKRLPFTKFKGSKYFLSFLKACYALIRGADVYYSRDFYTAMFLVNMGKQVVHEFHSPLEMKTGVLGWLTKRYLRKAERFTVISNALKYKMLKEFNFPDNKVMVAHDASVVPTTTDKIDLGAGFHVGYVGHLYAGKGMEVVGKLAQSMTYLQFHVVGGNAEDIEAWQQQYSFPNLTYHGFIKQSVVSKYINAFDICLLPNQKVVNIWNNSTINISEYTSPLKMFEYMAHRKAIIASNLDVLREVLNENNAMLCQPENIDEWIKAVHLLKDNNSIRERISNNAYQDFKQKFTWNQRAKEILGKL